MNYRLADILGVESHKTPGTQVLDINVKDPISRLEILATHSGVSVSATSHHLNCISKIELVDGSNVLFSLSGMEAQAVDFYDGNRNQGNVICYTDTYASGFVIGINFGRYLYDPVLAFDPKKFTNPQLKISHDYTKAGGTNTDLLYQVKAHVFDEKAVTPIGFLMAKEIKSYTGVQDGYSYTDMPTDYPYRSIALQWRVPGKWIGDAWSSVRLSEDNDKRIPFDYTSDEIERILGPAGGLYREQLKANITAAFTTFEVTPVSRLGVMGKHALAQHIMHWGEEEGCNLKLKRDPATGSGIMTLAVEGYIPHGVVMIPFGLKNDIDDWYDVTKIGNLELRTKGANSPNAVNTNNILVQQFRKYAA